MRSTGGANGRIDGPRGVFEEGSEAFDRPVRGFAQLRGNTPTPSALADRLIGDGMAFSLCFDVFAKRKRLGNADVDRAALALRDSWSHC